MKPALKKLYPIKEPSLKQKNATLSLRENLKKSVQCLQTPKSMVSNDISVILNLACIKATGYPLPADGEDTTQWFYRTNYINLVPEMIGKRYAFMKEQPKPTLEYLPPLYRPSTLNDFGLQVKRRLIVTEIQERFGMKSRIDEDLKIVYELTDYYENYCRRLANLHQYNNGDISGADPESDTELPWHKEMIRMILSCEEGEDYYKVESNCYSSGCFNLDNRDLQWRVDNYSERIRPKIMYVVWDLQSKIYFPPDDTLGIWIRMFKRIDKKILEFKKELKKPTYPIKYDIHEAMRDNIEGRMFGKTSYAIAHDIVERCCPKVCGWGCEYLTQCGQLKKNKKIQKEYIDAYNKINAILPDIQASYNKNRLPKIDRMDKSFIPIHRDIKNRLNQDVTTTWRKEGALDQDTVLRVFTGKRNSSEEVIMNLDLESSYAKARRS